LINWFRYRKRWHDVDLDWIGLQQAWNDNANVMSISTQVRKVHSQRVRVPLDPADGGRMGSLDLDPCEHHVPAEST